MSLKRRLIVTAMILWCGCSLVVPCAAQPPGDVKLDPKIYDAFLGTFGPIVSSGNVQEHAIRLYGEVGLIDGGPRAASIQTQEACEVLFIPRKTVMELLQHNADAAVIILRTVIDRLGEAHRKMASLALSDVYGRVARVLLETGRYDNGPGFPELMAIKTALRTA